ncbi:hypothetical protein PT974_04695 [Cladobotryum mycophilum]|uniref:SNF2 N-terminal domain-containing protein n=1 Tax=Cladobotryum mycophilum TaxID=491253 RepID=A0ABR0SRA6_9HYPO
MDAVNSSDVMTDAARDTAKDVKKMAQRFENAYKFERFMNNHPPPQLVDFNDICKSLGISPYPELALYPGKPVETLKPYQVADLGEMLNRFKAGMPSILANEMGLGKTKTFIGSIEVKVRYKMNLRNSGVDVKFYPTLIINPVSTILQTFQEVKQHLTLNAYVYYSLMKKTDQPSTGRIVILTTFPTLYTRQFKRIETRFVIRQTTSKRKRDSTDTDTNKRFRTDEDVARDLDELAARENDGGSSTRTGFESDEAAMERAGDMEEEDELSTNKRIRKYYARDINEKEIVRLPRGSRVRPDGNLIEYVFSRNAELADICFETLIVDEAHVARKLNGAYNHMFRLLDWQDLV